MAPIAIVGMSCRLSGDVSTPEDFWTLLSRSRDGWSPVPEDRFSSDTFYHPNPQKKGCFNFKGGYFMKHDLSKFDAPFFHITAPEAMAMDPQQRQLLECTYEALENAGISKESIAGRNMGVFIGGTSSDYHLGTLKELNQMPMFDSTGNHQSIQAGRISYYFDLRGPCFAVDTACSSGLYALHSAVQCIRSGEADSAVVAGCSLHLQPDEMISMSMLGIYNDDGKTFAFDHRAKSGFARGEGVGCLVLKPLDQAIKDNDKIRSVIVSTGINHDGKTVGLATPNGSAQEQLIRDVYARANISPEDTGFVEAHGTGTKVGDPIEAGAIYRVFGPGRTKRFPLYMGSAKTNFGHLENASGLVSIIKASLMLEKGFILPNVNFEKANEAIPLDEWNIKIPHTTRPWPKNKRFISVNNFGFGGSNAHVVLERPPLTISDLPQSSKSEIPKLFVLSANDEEAAKRVASQLGVYIEQHPEVFQKRLTSDIAYTLGQRRTHHSWRIALVGKSCDDLVVSLNGSGAIPARAPTVDPKVAFVYTGQGAQWPQMGRELMDTNPVFASTMNAAAAHLKQIGADFCLLEELSKPEGESNMDKAHIAQPICTAIQLGLTDMLATWGVKPSMVMGHSSGEIAAAYATGAITLEDSMAISYHRGQLAAKLMAKKPDLRGGMLAVGAGASEIKGIIKVLGLQNITIACENSPNSATASGNEDDVDKLAAELKKRETFHRKLRVDVAYHSAHMQLVADEYMESIKGMTPKIKEEVTFYSSLLGNKLDLTASLGPSYWVENLTKPVLFSSAMQELYNDGKPDVIVEIGPHAALKGPIQQILKSISQQAATEVKYFSSLVRKQDATNTTLKLAGDLFVKGQTLDFGLINYTEPGAQKPCLVTDFAPYPFAPHKYWFESRASKQHRLKPFGRHDLLGVLEDTYSDSEPTWRNTLNLDDVPWLKDHRMQSLPTFPLAGYLCMAVEAASQRAQLRGLAREQIAGFRLREIQVSKAFILDPAAQYETLFSLTPYAEGTRSYSNEWDEFRISSWTATRGWLEHCRGLVGVRQHRNANPVSNPQLQAAAAHRKHIIDVAGAELSLDDFYTELETRGAGYSEAFKFPPGCGLKAQGEYSAATVVVPDTASCMPSAHETPSILPAAFMDLCSQLMFPILGAGRGEMPSLFMPSAIKEVEITNSFPSLPGEKVQVVVHGRPDFASPGPVDFMISAWDDAHSEPVAKFSGFRMTPVSSDIMDCEVSRSLCYKVQWEPLDKPTEAGTEEENGQVEETTQSTGVELKGEEFVIITDKTESNPLVFAISSILQAQTGFKPSVSTMAEVRPSSTVRYICLAELDAPLLYNMSVTTFDQVKNLLLTCSSMLWVTSGAYRFAEKPENNIVQGLLRTVRSENSKVAATLDLDPTSQLGPSDHAELVLRALLSSLDTPEDGSPVDFEFSEDNGKLVVPRVVEHEDMNLTVFRETQISAPYLQDFEQPGRRLKLAVGTLGALDSLYWKDEADLPLPADDVEIKITATGMNFKDVVIAMGQVASPYIGVECSGIISKVGSNVTSLRVGDRVCAMSLGAYSTYTRCPATSAALIPDSISFETAASIPVVYSTAYYGIVNLARMEPGERILIHAASGGVGQAAIQLAQMIGAEIYATVGSVEKKQLLIDTYGIPENRIFYSRDTEFGAAVKEATGGEGVDVVINSLAGDMLRVTWECLAPFGRFVEIGKRDITSNTRLEMAKFEHNCTFSSVDLTLVAAKRPKIMGRVLTAVMNLLSKNTIKPIGPITIVPISEVELSLRKLQSGKTSGKVIVSHTNNEQVKATHPISSGDLLRGDATYVIIGGTGGLGRSMARKMVQRGARHIVLLSRSGKATTELGKLIKESQAVGAAIHVKSCDVADEASVKSLVAELQQSLPPIRGIIHAAMVLIDVLFEKMTFEDYENVTRSKVNGAWNFHNALTDTPLDFFIVLSSVAGIVGNRGQAAYAAANTFLDAFVRYRTRHGLAASSLDLTAVDGVGYLAENASRQSQVLKNLSGNTLNESEVLALVEAAIEGKVTSTCDGQCVTGLNFENPSSLPYYASDGKFSHLRNAALANSLDADGADGANLSISQGLQQTTTEEDAHEVVTLGIQEKLGAILMLPPEVMAAEQGKSSITALGLDSLNAIELRNWIGKELQAHLQVLELLTSGTMIDLSALVLRKTTLKGVWTKKEEA
ncbi:polyketide synthase [Ilyonectria sp. MPI-CAGE-AT-0026]|nr:polyketide synthase [Ilyonectria sp. MPI-CAGE-AT-0026]